MAMYKMQNLSHQTFAFYTCLLSHFRTFAFCNNHPTACVLQQVSDGVISHTLAILRLRPAF